jgi:tRNA(Ile)-lysidine synthase
MACFVYYMRRAQKNDAAWNPQLLRNFPPARRYLIGVSGGRDSVALLHWLLDRGYRSLIVCHLDHQLRGRSSAADARFVGKLAAKYEVDRVIGSTDVRALAANKKMSIETAARAARYNFFAQVGKRSRCRTVFLAHHADDLVETFLMNLFRGAGPAGLGAMREISPHQANGVELQVVRPLLGVWREEIDEYVRARQLKFRDDATNKSAAPLRNRIRHRVIPYLEKQFGREIRRSVWRTATIAAEEENFFEALLPPKLTKLSQLAVKEMRALPTAVQRRALHHWLRASDVQNLSFDLIERVRALLDLVNRVAKTNLPGNRHARRRAGKIFIQ